MSEKTTKPRNNRRYVRNLTRAQVILRFQGSNERRVVLYPRGQRGDLHPIVTAELDQLPDVGGIYEILTDYEGKEVIAKQTSNQQAYHPAISALRNNYGEQVGAVVMETLEKSKGHLVAQVEANDPRDGNLKRVQVTPITHNIDGPEQTTVPGSVGYEPVETTSQGVGKLEDLGITVSMGKTQKAPKT